MNDLKSRLKFLVYVPMTFVFVGNAFLLYLSNAPILLVASFLFFIISLIFTRKTLHHVTHKLRSDLERVHEGIKTLNYTAALINKEAKKSAESQYQAQDLSQQIDELEVICNQMKDMIVLSLQHSEKEHLVVARQLGKLCLQTRQITRGLQNTSDDAGDIRKGQFETLLLISENLMNHTDKLTSICDAGRIDEKELKPMTSSLRRAMKIPHNNAA